MNQDNEGGGQEFNLDNNLVNKKGRNGREFQLGIMKKFWSWIVTIVLLGWPKSSFGFK